MVHCGVIGVILISYICYHTAHIQHLARLNAVTCNLTNVTCVPDITQCSSHYASWEYLINGQRIKSIPKWYPENEDDLDDCTEQCNIHRVYANFASQTTCYVDPVHPTSCYITIDEAHSDMTRGLVVGLTFIFFTIARFL